MNIEESKINAKKIRTGSFGFHQEVNLNARYLRTGSSNIHLIHHTNEPRDSDSSLSSESISHSQNHSHRLESSDLVEHLFGSLVPIRVAAVVLLAFLQLDLVQARSQHDDVPHPVSTEDKIDACIHAAVELHNKLYQKEAEDIRSLYHWEWSPHFNTRTGAGAALFLNIVAVIAHQVVSSVSAPSGLANTPIKTLWTTISNPNDSSDQQCEDGQTPSSSSCSSSNDSDRQDPNIVAIPIEAFTTLGPSDNAGHSSIFSKLKTILSDTPTTTTSLSATHPSWTSFSSDDNPSIIHHKERDRRPSVFSTIESIFTDLPTNTPPTSNETSPSMASSTNEVEDYVGVEDLRTFLRSQTKWLSIDLQDFSHLQQDQIQPEFMCFEGFTITGKVEDTQDSPSNYVSRVLTSMQRQQLAQPHLHFVLGVVVMGDIISLCRGDSVGTEECTFDLRTGSGILEIIRLTLGLAVADNKTLGYDLDFELEKAFGHSSVGARSEWKTKIEKGLGNSNEGVVFVPKYYNTPPDNTGRSQRYYLHYLVDNRGSFGGRMTRVWCAYRQVKTEEEIMELVHDDDQNEARETVLRKDKDIFVGPYALKYQSTDTSSITWKENVVSRILEAVENEKNVTQENRRTGVECILLPQYIHKGAKILHRRGITEERGVPEALSKLTPKQGIVTISLFKRTLFQYKKFKEVAFAIADGLRAINWLNQKGFLHRDISDGNLLLSRENPSTFEKPFSPELRVVLCRRKVSSPKGIYGLLHDFDLAGLVSVEKHHKKIQSASKGEGSSISPKSSVQTHSSGPIGTPAFMSVAVAEGKIFNHCHTVADDVESLFYVLYLFPFSNTTPRKPVSYPHTVPDTNNIPQLPRHIKRWTTIDAHNDLRQLAMSKFGFFHLTIMHDDLDSTGGMHFKKNWKKGSKERKLWEDLVNIFHHEYLFSHPQTFGTRGWVPQGQDVIEASIPKLIKDLYQRIGRESHS